LADFCLVSVEDESDTFETFQIDLLTDSAVAPVAERRLMLSSLIAEVDEVITWKAKEVLLALGVELADIGHLIDLQIGVWLLHSDQKEEAYTLDKLQLKFQISGQLAPPVRLWRLWKVIKAKLLQENLYGVLLEQEMRLVVVLVHMERYGFRFDASGLTSLSAKMKQKMLALQLAASELFPGRELNLGSPQQMAQLLFDELQLVPAGAKATAKGSRLAVTKEVLELLRDHHPIVTLCLEYRKIQKLQSVYLDGLLAHISGDCICASWQQITTGTGRLSCTNPNLQNLPKRPVELQPLTPQEEPLLVNVRAYFVAKPYYRLISCDYSSMEMRLLASLSGDVHLQRLFRDNRDIHREVYGLIRNKPVLEVSDAEREIAKRIVYAILYGMGAEALGKHLSMSTAEARTWMHSFLSSFPQLKAYLGKIAAAGKRNGSVRTIAGRKRHISSAHLAVNSVIQGSAADVMKRALVNLQFELTQRQLDAKIVSTIHDEIVVECHEKEVEQTQALMLHVMQHGTFSPAILSVPLISTVQIGTNLSF
jgi:DNA polymerase-1